MDRPAMLLPPLLLATLAGCAQTTPAWDQSFGDSVRQMRAQQTMDPAAGLRASAQLGLDGKASVGVMRALGISYGYSLREPVPPAQSLGATPGAAAGQ